MPQEVEKLIIQIAGDSSQFRKELKKMKTDAKGFEGTMKSLAVKGGIAFTAMGAAASVLGVKATQAFAKFETGVTSVSKTTNLAGKDLEDFKKEIISMSGRIPVGTDRLLEIATAAGQLGIKGVPNLTKFTETIAKLGATTDLEGEDAALAIARILNITNEGIDTVDRFGATIVDLGNNFAATESEILEVSKDVAKATVQFGLGSEQILGMSAAMASLGVAAEAGGTVVGKAFMAIDQAIRAQGTPAFEKLVELTGITGDQLQQTFERDAAGVFQEFIQGLGRAEKGGKDLTAELAQMELSGIRVNKILPTLAGRSDLLAQAMDRAGIAAEDASALNTEAAKAFDTTANKFITAQTKLNNSLILMGEQIAPNATDAINDLSTSVKNAGPLWVALGKGIGVVLKGVSNIIKFFSMAFGLGNQTIQDYIDETHAAAKKDQAFLSKQLKERGITNATFRRKQRQLRRKAAQDELKDTKKSDENIRKTRVDNQKKTNGELLTQRSEALDKQFNITEEAAEEEFAAMETQTDEILNEYERRNQEIATEQEKALGGRIKTEKDYYADLINLQNDKAGEAVDIKKQEQLEFDNLYAKHHKGVLASETAFGQQMVMLKKLQGSGEYDATKTAAGELSQLINSENNELKQIGKAATIVQMGISTAESAMKAFSSLAWIPYVGPVLGGVAAAAIAAYGAEKISKVNAMQAGGIVPGSGRGDKVPTLLEPGELVVPRDITTEILREYGARTMADGGKVAGAKENKSMYQTFADIFSVPGVFKAILGGGEAEGSASGFGAQAFGGMIPAVIKDLEDAAEKMMDLVVASIFDRIPGGEILYEAYKITKIPQEKLKEIINDPKISKFLADLDISDEVLAGVGSAGGVISDFAKGIGGVFGFQEGGLVQAKLEPGEGVLSKGMTAELFKTLRMSPQIGSVRPSVTSKKTSTGTGGGTVRHVVELELKDDLVNFVSAKQREQDDLGISTR